VNSITNSTSKSDRLIAPEILDDAFYHAIMGLAQYEDLTSVLEIGSSAGGGSTNAFVRGLMLNKTRPTLYCMEVSHARFLELQRKYKDLDFIKCYNVSSVSSSRVASESEIRKFYHSQKTALNKYKLSVVLGWREEGLRYLTGHPDLDQDGILTIKGDNNIKSFDLVLIDGSEFTGMAELNDIHGAKIICLDDINAFKCHAVRQQLLNDPAYELLAENQRLRNGFSIFYRVDAACNLRAIKAVLEAIKLRADTRKLSWQRVVRSIWRV
jgi:predicted DNA binding CopG/RHH family protein